MVVGTASVSLAVFDHRETLYQSYYGYANMDQKLTMRYKQGDNASIYLSECIYDISSHCSTIRWSICKTSECLVEVYSHRNIVFIKLVQKISPQYVDFYIVSNVEGYTKGFLIEL